jgi:hypothetical protein
MKTAKKVPAEKHAPRGPVAPIESPRFLRLLTKPIATLSARSIYARRSPTLR